MLLGACVSCAGLDRLTARATLTLVVAAEIADIDVLYQLGGPVVGFQHHRGWTHSLLAIPLLGGLTLAVVWVIHHRLQRRALRTMSCPSGLPVRWGWLYGYACLGALTHLLLDYTTSYGIRLFEPFSFKWYAWDIVYKTEPYMWLVLGLGLAVPFISALAHRQRRRSRFDRCAAIIALMAIGVMWGFRDYQRRCAVAQLKAYLYRGEKPLRVSAYAYPWNPFLWHGVVGTSNFFKTARVDTLHGMVDPQDQAQIYHKSCETPVTMAAKNSALGRIYLDWASYPVTETDLTEAGDVAYCVRFYDLRSIHPIYAWVRLDKNLQVRAQELGEPSSPCLKSL
jgi:inner membrane protein